MDQENQTIPAGRPLLPGELKLGPLVIRPPVMLAPMAGITSWPVRLLCRKLGAPLAFTEMVAAAAIARGRLATDALDALKTHPDDRPLGIQLFGPDPEEMAGAAGLLSFIEADLIDINMGCPVRKVVRNGSGCGLMKDLDRAGRMVRLVRAAVKVPLTVKFRLGWDEDTKNAALLARVCEGEGADAVIVHGRTRARGFGGDADLAGIGEVVRAVRIPVIGNGGVWEAADAVKMMAETGCAAVMVARGARGNPWIFSEIAGRGHGPGLPERGRAILQVFQWMRGMMPEKRAVIEMRKHLAWFSKGTPGAVELRRGLHNMTEAGQLEEMVRRFFEV